MKTKYEKYKKLELWKLISETLLELKKNRDLQIFTDEDYITGYICKKLVESDLWSTKQQIKV